MFFDFPFIKKLCIIFQVLSLCTIVTMQKTHKLMIATRVLFMYYAGSGLGWLQEVFEVLCGVYKVAVDKFGAGR